MNLRAFDTLVDFATQARAAAARGDFGVAFALLDRIDAEGDEDGNHAGAATRAREALCPADAPDPVRPDLGAVRGAGEAWDPERTAAEGLPLLAARMRGQP